MYIRAFHLIAYRLVRAWCRLWPGKNDNTKTSLKFDVLGLICDRNESFRVLWLLSDHVRRRLCVSQREESSLPSSENLRWSSTTCYECVGDTSVSVSLEELRMASQKLIITVWGPDSSRPCASDSRGRHDNHMLYTARHFESSGSNGSESDREYEIPQCTERLSKCDYPKFTDRKMIDLWKMRKLPNEASCVLGVGFHAEENTFFVNIFSLSIQTVFDVFF